MPDYILQILDKIKISYLFYFHRLQKKIIVKIKNFFVVFKINENFIILIFLLYYFKYIYILLILN